MEGRVATLYSTLYSGLPAPGRARALMRGDAARAEWAGREQPSRPQGSGRCPG